MVILSTMKYKNPRLY